jgi:hypothetical protein
MSPQQKKPKPKRTNKLRVDQVVVAESAKRHRGRPKVEGRDGIMQRACERIATGQLVLDVAKAEGVAASCIYEWGMLPEYSEAYAKARISQTHALAEGALIISDGNDQSNVVALVAEVEKLKELTPIEKAAMLEGLAANATQRDRLRVDTRKWFVSKIAKKIYGDAVDVTSNGETLDVLLSKLPPVESDG